MVKINLKLTFLLLGLLFILIGAASASENTTDIVNDVNTTPPEEVENISTDITNSSVETNPVKKPPVKIEAKPVSGKQGQKVKITAKFKTQDNKSTEK